MKIAVILEKGLDKNIFTPPDYSNCRQVDKVVGTYIRIVITWLYGWHYNSAN